jgi:hypothetical protein
MATTLPLTLGFDAGNTLSETQTTRLGAHRPRKRRGGDQGRRHEGSTKQ